MKSRGAVARYLRIGEPAPERVEPTELGPHEVGSSGGAVARYLKIERHERPAVKKASASPKKRTRAPKAHRPVRQRRTVVAVELDPADTYQPVSAPQLDSVPTATVEAPKAAPVKVRRERAKRPTRAFCPDCEGEIEPGTDQCPHCALFLPKAA